MAQVDRLYGPASSAAMKLPVACLADSNITLNGEQTIDSVTTSGSRVAATNQTTATENGIYVSDSGAWTRAADFDGNYDVVQGTQFLVAGGTTYGGTIWQVTAADPIIIDTTSITMAETTFTAAAAAALAAMVASITATMTADLTTIMQENAGCFAAAGGTADAITATFSPVFTSLTNGSIVFVRAASANATTTPTFMRDSLAANTITKGAGAALALGDIAGAGHWLALMYDSTSGTEVLLNPAKGVAVPCDAVVGASRNLVGSSAGSVKTASWTASELVAETALGGVTYKGASLSLSFDGATTGANGMDTGSTPTSADLHVYAIYNPTTNAWATLGTTSGSGAAVYGGANPVSGYTASVLINSYKMNGSGQFAAFFQFGADVYTAAASALSGGSSVTYAAVSLSSLIPANAKTVTGDFGASGYDFYLAMTAAGLGQVRGSAGAAGVVSQYRMTMAEAQKLYYKVSGGSAGGITVCGYSV